MNTKLFKRYGTHNELGQKGPYVFGINIEDAEKYVSENLENYHITTITAEKDGVYRELQVRSLCEKFTRSDEKPFMGYYVSDVVSTSEGIETIGIILNGSHTVYEQSVTTDNQDIVSMINSALHRYYGDTIPANDFLLDINQEENVLSLKGVVTIDMNHVNVTPNIFFFAVSKSGALYLFSMKSELNGLYLNGVGDFEAVRALVERRKGATSFCFNNYSFTEAQTNILASYFLSNCRGYGNKADWRGLPLGDEVYNEFVRREWREVLR